MSMCNNCIGVGWSWTSPDRSEHAPKADCPACGGSGEAMNNPQPSDPIGEVLKTLRVGGLYGDRGDSQDRAHHEAHAAIERMIAELIGDDEDAEMIGYNHGYWPNETKVARNELRTEQRARLSSLTQNTKNGLTE